MGLTDFVRQNLNTMCSTYWDCGAVTKKWWKTCRKVGINVVEEATG